MAFLEECEKIINIVIGEYLLNNQEVCKLLYYYPTNNDYSYNPLAQKNLTNTRELLMTHIYPLPKQPDAVLEQKAYININITGGERIKNSSYRKVILVFDIICHLDSWIIRNGLRPYRIANKIEEMFNNQLTKLPIENKPISLPFKVIDYSNKYYGIKLAYELMINSNLSCYEE